MEIKSKRILQSAGLLSLAAALSFGAFGAIKMTHASSTKTQTTSSQMMGMMRGFGQQPAASGTVSAINGNSITLNGSNGTTYTVDATNAILDVQKPAGTALNNSGIMNGDTITVFGTVSGNNIAATRIVDGKNFKGRMGMGKPIMGTVSAINGNSVTLNSNGTAFTVDLSNAKITQFANNTKTSIQASGIKTGDNLVVFGTVSGNNVAATNVIDGNLPQGGFGRMHRMGMGGMGMGNGSTQSQTQSQ